jgi:hypothetical protein
LKVTELGFRISFGLVTVRMTGTRSGLLEAALEVIATFAL